VVPGTIRSVLRGERPVIRSDGRFVRDYFYVEDGAHAYVTLAEALAAEPARRGRAYNFSLETELTVLDVVHRILAAMGSDLEPDVRAEATHEILRQSLSARRAREELGWSPRFSFDEGLRRTIAWYTDLLAAPSREEP
jgi:CDP-glucose 4,6-dehydratase